MYQEMLQSEIGSQIQIKAILFSSDDFLKAKLAYGSILSR